MLALIEQVDQIRKEHPGCGIEKMYYIINPDFIGRDAFIDYFMQLGYRVKRNKNYRRTTYASAYSYPNIIKGKTINNYNEIWQTDITYFEVNQKFYYGVFIIDVYTKEIVGYEVSNHMRAIANVKALNKAIKNHGIVKVHHSDRGSQYSSRIYTDILKQNGIEISMGLTAQDNAYAERINKTIKEEYLIYWEINSEKELKKCVAKAVENYNTKRLHNSIEMTPIAFKNKILNLQEQDRPKVTIYTEGKDKTEATSSRHSFKQDFPQVQNYPKKKQSKNIQKTVNLI